MIRCTSLSIFHPTNEPKDIDDPFPLEISASRFASIEEEQYRPSVKPQLYPNRKRALDDFQSWDKDKYQQRQTLFFAYLFAMNGQTQSNEDGVRGICSPCRIRETLSLS